MMLKEYDLQKYNRMKITKVQVVIVDYDTTNRTKDTL